MGVGPFVAPCLQPMAVVSIKEVVMHKLDWSAYGQHHNKSDPPPEKGIAKLQMQGAALVSHAVDRLAGSWLRRRDFAYHVLRMSMVIVFLFFGYQKWFEYEARILIPYISNGPLIFWLYPVFGIQGASRFLGVSEWLFGTLLLLGFWNKYLGILGALGSVVTFVGTVTIIPFMPNGWEPSAGGFPAMVGNVPFLMKDVVLLAVSIYLLKEDVERVRDQLEPTTRTKCRTGSLPNKESSAPLPLNAPRR
jgi:uncharacterized membrane protein YkgB